MTNIYAGTLFYGGYAEGQIVKTKLIHSNFARSVLGGLGL